MNYWLSCIERGRYAWAAWLPVLAACSFVLLVGANISGLSGPATALAIGSKLTPLELIALFVCSPLFFTRFSNLFALAVTVYLCERFLLANDAALSLAPSLLLTQTTILAVLADRMPWSQAAFKRNQNAKLKEALLQILVIFSLISTLYTLTHLRAWQLWMFREYGINISQVQAFTALFALIGLWLLASLNYLRSSALIIAALPSLAVSAYALSLPMSVLVSPFVLGLALSLTQIRRQYIVYG